MSKIINYQDVLNKIIKIWAVCYGAITLQIVAGYFLSHILLPYLGFLLILLIVWMVNRNVQQIGINCSVLTHFTIYALAVSDTIMLVANLMNTNFITNRYSEFSHQSYPFHAAFIVYPIATIFFGIAAFRRGQPHYCQECRSTAEFSVEESLRRNVLHHESKIQIRMAFVISLLMSIVSYVYYYFFYRSGISFRKYSPDIFFLYILPGITFVVSMFFVMSRYFTLEMEVSLRTNSHDPKQQHSHIRYMVVWRDRLLLKDIVGDGLSSIWDTPVDISQPYAKTISNWQAETAFKKVYGSDAFTLKRLFETINKPDNCLHCAAFLDDKAEYVNGMGGEWFTLRDVDMMLKMGTIARPFAIELYRVYTITMAWKTYRRDGTRIYPIKNYRPTFRLRDFKDWDVDYNDSHWLDVANNNEDRPFYRLRRFWQRLSSTSQSQWEKDKS